MTGQLDVVIIGAGPSGLAMAGLLAQDGHWVTVYESRPDPRAVSFHDSRSINLTLSARGLDVLARLGMAGDVVAKANTIGARLLHAPDGQEIFQRYGAQDNEVLFSITREALLLAMLRRISSFPNVHVQFNTRFADLDKISGTVTLQETISSRRFRVWPGLIVGADGAFSSVRHHINKRETADLLQEYFSWSYKEVIISAAAARVLGLRTDVLHVWPRPHALFVAFANRDGSFGCNLFCERNGDFSFDSLADEHRLSRFLADQFEDLTPIAAELARNLNEQKEGTVVRIRSSRWHWGNKAVLIGDAAHAIYQFYGHGTSADLEDCWTLSESLREHSGDLQSAFTDFERRRMYDTWVLSELSRRHFFTLKDRSATLRFRARLATDAFLAKAFPESWHMEYALVAHSSKSYAEISQIMGRQRLVWWLSGLCLVTAMVLVILFVHGMGGRLKNWGRRSRLIHRLLLKPA